MLVHLEPLQQLHRVGRARDHQHEDEEEHEPDGQREPRDVLCTATSRPRRDLPLVHAHDLEAEDRDDEEQRGHRARARRCRGRPCTARPAVREPRPRLLVLLAAPRARQPRRDLGAVGRPRPRASFGRGRRRRHLGPSSSSCLMGFAHPSRLRTLHNPKTSEVDPVEGQAAKETMRVLLVLLAPAFGLNGVVTRRERRAALGGGGALGAGAVAAAAAVPAASASAAPTRTATRTGCPRCRSRTTRSNRTSTRRRWSSTTTSTTPRTSPR